jgi:hypothetical protein
MPESGAKWLYYSQMRGRQNAIKVRKVMISITVQSRAMKMKETWHTSPKHWHVKAEKSYHADRDYN